MLKVFPTPGAYPRNTLKRPCCFSVSLVSSQSSGDFLVSLTPYNTPHELAPCRCDCTLDAGICCSRRNRTRIQTLASRQPYYRCALAAASYSSARGRMGSPLRRGDLDRCDSLLQLLLPPTRRHLYHRRTAELARTLRLSGHGHHRQPPLPPRPQSGERALARGSGSSKFSSASAANSYKPKTSPHWSVRCPRPLPA